MHALNAQIGKYRIQIMGIATIGVLLVHSNDVVAWPTFIKSIFGYGGVGVYIFVFLSALGLYNSLKSRGEAYSKTSFYKRRFIRLVIPYCIIAATWYGINDLIINGSLLLFLYDLSTLSFWIDHQGAWYVAMLIPVYLTFPWFYDWAEKNKNVRVYLSFVIAIALSAICSTILPNMYEHLAQVFSSITVYLIGYWYAGLNSKSNRNSLIISGVCLLIFMIKSLTPLKNIDFIAILTWTMLGIPFTFLFAYLLDRLDAEFINIVLAFFGKYSLEMYLWNIFVIQAARTFGIFDTIKKYGDENGYISYGIVIVTGCILSVLYGKLSRIIIQRFIK